jgi:hypothetical protein
VRVVAGSIVLLGVLAPLAWAGCIGAPFSQGGPGGSATTTGTGISTTVPCTDVGNCGVGYACVAGGCACAGDLTCPPTSPDVCTSKTGIGDSKNCGQCGSTCEDSEVCNDGKCVCRPSLTMCSGDCVDLDTDPANCGACGAGCGNGQLCVAGAGAAGKCIPPAAAGANPCGPGYTHCPSGICVLDASLLNDPLNCGGCGSVCGPDQVCVVGSCKDYYVSPSCTACPCAACDSAHTCCHSSGGFLCVAGTVCG